MWPSRHLAVRSPEKALWRRSGVDIVSNLSPTIWRRCSASMIDCACFSNSVCVSMGGKEDLVSTKLFPIQFRHT